MSEFNLIPADYAREQVLRRRVRKASAGVLLLCCLVLLARSALGLLVTGERNYVAQLQTKRQLWQESKAKTEQYTRDALVAEKQLLALNELRRREHLRLFLEALDTAYVDKVWLEEIKYYRRENLPAAAPAAGTRAIAPAVAQKGAGAPAARVEQRIAMTGHATNHVMLAEFMRKLENQPAVAELTLLDTSPRAYPQGLIIDFKLALLVERKAKGLP
jgi:hypothetical protein